MLFGRLVFTQEICSEALAKCLACEKSDQTVDHVMQTTDCHTRVLSPITPVKGTHSCWSHWSLRHRAGTIFGQ